MESGYSQQPGSYRRRFVVRVMSARGAMKSKRPGRLRGKIVSVGCKPLAEARLGRLVGYILLRPAIGKGAWRTKVRRTV
jgi:hypothetical protein